MWIALLALSFATRAAPRGAVYYTGTYPADHWALRATRPGDDTHLGMFESDGARFGVYLHPGDRRGYRALVALVADDMASTLNRDFTARERRGLYLALARVSEVYGAVGLIAQTLVLGNNAHEFIEATCTIRLGSPREPLLLHGHVIGRGDPRHAYVGGVPLGGPPPGEVFGVRDRTHGWTPDQMRAVAAGLRAAWRATEPTTHHFDRQNPDDVREF